LKKKVLEIVYESTGKKQGSTVKPSLLKITFKSQNECVSAHSLINKVIDERAPTLDGATGLLKASPRGAAPSPPTRVSSATTRKKLTANSTVENSPQTPHRAAVTLRNKDKGAASLIASMLDACPTRTVSGGSTFDRKVSGTSLEDFSPCLYVVQDVATVNVVAAMAAGDIVLHSLDPGSIFAPDATFFG
jgi:hypothetical protein